MRNIQAKQGEGILELSIRGFASILEVFDIALENNVSLTDEVAVGTILKLPEASKIPEGKVYRLIEAPIEIVNAPKKVTVQRGESLYDLAVSQLGDITRVYDLAKENNIGADSSLLIGMPICYPNEKPNKVARALFGLRPATAYIKQTSVLFEDGLFENGLFE